MFFTKTAGRHNLVEVVLKVFRPSYLEKTTNNPTLNGGRGGGVGVEGFALSARLVLPAPAGRTVPLMGLNAGQKIPLLRVTFSRLQEYASRSRKLTG